MSSTPTPKLTTQTPPTPTPSEDDKADFLLSCRYGELDAVQHFVSTFGAHAALAADVTDDNGNTPLHMVAGNGHDDILSYLLSLLPPTPTPTPTNTNTTNTNTNPSSSSLTHTHRILSARNASGSTPLHWASLNQHLSIAQRLIEHPSGPGASLIDIRNDAGVSPLGEAERGAWEEGARWMVGVMDLNLDSGRLAATEAEAEEEEEGMEVRDVEVEIQDADGGIAKMSLSARELQAGATADVKEVS